MQPVPGRPISTPYGKRGKHWSCRKTAAGGIHTGADFAAPLGTTIVAPIAGTIRHRNYGSAFGRHQFAISPDPGQPFAAGEVFFAHTRTRLKDGTRVKAGDKVAEVGSEGNSTGPHLHMEFMPNSKGKWNCNVQANPAPVINWQEDEDVEIFKSWFGGKPAGTQKIGTGYTRLKDSQYDPKARGLDIRMVYLNVKGAEGTGFLRIRGVRADGDKTGYHDYPILQPGQLITHVYFEPRGAKDGPTYWQAKCWGGLKSVTLDTRYAKTALIYKTP